MLKNVIYLFCLVLLNGCLSRQNDRIENIHGEIEKANLLAIIEAENTSLVPINYYSNGDTLLFEEKGIGAYMYDKDSLNGKEEIIDSTSTIIYRYKINNACVFYIYDSQGKFVNKGLLYEPELLKAIHSEYYNSTRMHFYDKFISERNKSYNAIEEKYFISRNVIDSLFLIRFQNFPNR